MGSRIAPDLMKQYGPRLRAMREGAGLSLGQVSKLTGVSSAHIGLIEDAAIESITSMDIARLLDIYHCTFDELQADPLPYLTDDEALAALKKGELTDAQFMLWMKRDHFIAQRYARRDH